jgi:hypothetical protein
MIAVLARVAGAEPEADADRAFRDALGRAAAHDPGALDALEALGGARPVTRWTDDAWSEAARLAEQTGDYARARRDLAEVVAVGTDEALVRRARAALARLGDVAGPAGEWSGVAAEHERLTTRLAAGGDPKPALAELEALVDANPGYPRVALAMIAIAQGWERDGDGARAIAWLRRAEAAAIGIARWRAGAELARALIRQRALDDARTQIDALARVPDADAVVVAHLRDGLATAERRETVRWLLWAVLAAIAVAAAVALRRGAGSWRAVAARLARVPVEVMFFAPIAVVLVAVAHTGNPLVARAVRAIAIVGTAIAWLSGAMLDGERARSGRVRLVRAVGHAVIAVVAVVAATYLALDRDRMLDLVVETWRSGPAAR